MVAESHGTIHLGQQELPSAEQSSGVWNGYKVASVTSAVHAAGSSHKQQGWAVSWPQDNVQT